MSARPDFERRVADWLQADATAAGSERVLAAALARVAVAGQERYVTQRVFGDRLGSSPQVRWAVLVATVLAAILAAAALIGGRLPQPARPPAGGFIPGPSLVVARGMHTATLLPDGRVLVVGGLGGGVIPIDSVELWDGSAASFSALAPLPLPRGGHTATLLPDGRVLIVGSDGTPPDFADPASAELWDPVTRSFTPTGTLAVPRWGHTATLLPDGRVLVVGGTNPVSPDDLVTEAEIWDPASGTFSSAGSLAAARMEHTATLLHDGRVLVLGGGDACRAATAELWDPATTSFTPARAMATSRAAHTATLLPDGRVLIVGGSGLESAELWDPASGSFGPAGSMRVGRSNHTATLLSDGRVLVVGGRTEAEGPGIVDALVLTAEAWDPETSRFQDAGTLASGRQFHTATLLPDGRVLVTGHGSRNDPLASSEVWDPNLAGAPPSTISPTPPRTPSGPPPTAPPQPAGSGPAPTPDC